MPGTWHRCTMRCTMRGQVKSTYDSTLRPSSAETEIVAKRLAVMSPITMVWIVLQHASSAQQPQPGTLTRRCETCNWACPRDTPQATSLSRCTASASYLAM